MRSHERHGWSIRMARHTCRDADHCAGRAAGAGATCIGRPHQWCGPDCLGRIRPLADIRDHVRGLYAVLYPACRSTDPVDALVRPLPKGTPLGLRFDLYQGGMRVAAENATLKLEQPG